jgi:hypothetical protein
MQPICTKPVSRTWSADVAVRYVVEDRLTERDVEQHGHTGIESERVDDEGTKDGGYGATDANEDRG